MSDRLTERYRKEISELRLYRVETLAQVVVAASDFGDAHEKAVWLAQHPLQGLGCPCCRTNSAPVPLVIPCDGEADLGAIPRFLLEFRETVVVVAPDSARAAELVASMYSDGWCVDLSCFEIRND